MRACILRLPSPFFLLLFLVLAGCKPRPLVCEAEKYFQIPAASLGPAQMPASREQFGSEVSARGLLRFPLFVAFTGDTRARVDWMSFDVVTVAEVVYSPGEALARPVRDPDRVIPLRRFREGQTERVWLGFQTRLCAEVGPREGLALCREFGGEQAFFVADMACSRSR